MIHDMIQVGDVVEVVLAIGDTHYSSYTASVRKVSPPTGGYWIFEKADGSIHYVQQFVEIIKYQTKSAYDGCIAPVA